MTWWQIALLVVVAVLVVVGLVATLRARSLDQIHKNVTKSRIALERALAERATAALEVARAGVLDVASAVVVNGVAGEALAASREPIVDDGWEAITIADDAGRALPASAPEERPDRLLLESELSRVLRHSVDQLDSDTRLAALNQARVAVQMTRRFHNIHVSQARRVRKSTLVRLLRLGGNAPEPQTVNLDDRLGRE